MATLVAGIQYGLSSQIDVHENKTLIFVKLTDSASRAIDDYLQNQYELDHKPTIQFLGNKGQLNFPFTNHRELKGSSRFIFSLSGNKDIEGSQGGFDCVQQTGPRSLESFGTLPFKMRIQANDDVYERTKHRMAVVEENNKTKCTRMIKPNTIDLGKKLNSKGYNKTNPLLNNSSSINLRHETLKEGNDITCKTVLSDELCVSSTSPIAKTSQNQMKLKSNDITRRPIKERLIHLLALRPFKKPEIYERISREGVKEKEKNVVSAMLKQIAFVRDNTYNLHRWVWNDVQEDWSFYSEQEKAILKKQRPQNLTPPGSTDSCSSASSKSPNSTYYDSPTSIPASSTDALGSKRSGYFLNVDDINTKRPRISHHFKNMSNIESTLQVSIDYHNSKIEDENSLKNVIPDQEKFNNDVNLLNYEAPIEIKKMSNTDDYLKYYTKICSSEQRTQYKAEFNAFYEEYKALHLETVKISDHFKLMEEQLKKEFELKNITKYEAIKKEILEKYKKSKSVHIQFNSLHNKLGYIKKLVAEYDLQVNQQILPKDLVPDEKNRVQQINDNQERCLKEKLPQQVLPTHSYTMAQISS